MIYLQTTYELCFGEAYFEYFESCDFSHEYTNIDVSVFMFDLRMINMSSECEYDWYVYVIWMWIDWYRKYQHAEPEYAVCCRVSEANESQTSYSVEQADIFQYQSYSHSDDMCIILKSNMKTDTSIGLDICIFAGKSHDSKY